MTRANRRDFIKTTAAAGAALSLTAASYQQVLGSNERIGIAFLGVGGRCQQHIDVVNNLARAGRGVTPVAVCDVWDGEVRQGVIRGRGLYPSAQKCGLQRDDRVHVTKDYRRLLGLREVDAVCIAAPDHWHAKMSIDAAAAGKHIYCEKPMTKTIEEAHAVVDAVRRANVVMTVGVQSMADPSWRLANEMIRRGDIGHVAQAQTSYYRNSLVGQWRYYPLTRDMTPRTIDWDMWVGHRFSVFPGVPLAPSRPFDRAVWAQWRCYWDFGSGMFTDLFVHQTTHMISAMGVRYPARVVGAGGIYLEYDGRDVPDVATVVADYDEGCQLIISATMINDYPLEEVIRGRLATLKFTPHTVTRDGRPERRGPGMDVNVLPQNIGSRPTGPAGGISAASRVIPTTLESDDTTALWGNFLECVRSHNRETWSTPELGAAAFATVNMGVLSYRRGQVLFWDRERRRPMRADDTWATRWERRSHERDRHPSQVQGWAGGSSGSFLVPPDYQRLEGPWTDGREPGAAGGRSGS